MSNLTSYQRKALAHDKHIALTANAGSGKTSVFAERYISIAENIVEKNSLRRIVAITFTEKAAGELQTRIAGLVDHKILNSKGSKEKRNLINIRRQLVSANISTIHSFCGDLLREFSTECGIDANYVVLDENRSSELIELSVQEIISGELRSPVLAEPVKNLVRVLGSVSKLNSELISGIKYRKNLLTVIEKLYSGGNQECEAKYNTLINLTAEKYFNPLIRNLIRDIGIMNDLVLSLNNSESNQVSNLLVDLRENNGIFVNAQKLRDISEIILTKSKKSIRVNDYLKKAKDSLPAKLQATILQNISVIERLAESSDALLTSNLFSFGVDFSSLFITCNEKYEEKKRHNGALDFEDFLLKTMQLIKKEEVRKYLSENYDYIMIDEYQDTNEIQYQIFIPILEGLSRGNLFVVGDDKQSIYRFRDAEIKVFEQTKRDINQSNQSNDGNLTLPHSFRLSPPIAFFVNYVFSRLMRGTDGEFNEVVYEELVCSKSEGETGEVVFLREKYEDGETEAALIAGKVHKLMSMGIALNDVAILCRRRDFFKEIESEFIEWGIPVKVIGGKGFYQKQILFDLLNYFRFLSDPGDDLSLIGLLRSPFFMIGDDVIHRISNLRGGSFFEKINEYAASDGGRIKSITSILKRHLINSAFLPLPKLFRLITTDSAFWRTISFFDEYQIERANLEKLYLILLDYSSNKGNSLFDFIEFLEQAVEKIFDEGEADLLDSVEAVQLMTIHQSKGLEFENVFIYRCSDSGGNHGIKARSVTIDKEIGILTKVPAAEDYYSGYKTPLPVVLYDYADSRREAAENKRLLYVAMTRAEKRLYLSFRDAKNDLFPATSFMGLISTEFPDLLLSHRINLKGKLKYLLTSENGEVNFSGNIELNIDVISESSEKITHEKADFETPSITKEDYRLKIEDSPRGEIISASSFAVFSQCPRKFELQYELGFNKVIDQLSLQSREKQNVRKDSYEFENEENTTGNAVLTGRIIHQLLEFETPPEKLDEQILSFLRFERLISPEQREPIIRNIRNIMQNYYSSKIYSELTNINSRKNEVKLMAAFKDFFLEGRIDRLNSFDEYLEIVDYKTDDISVEDLHDKETYYFNQLNFYAFILRLSQPVTKIMTRIVFLRMPEHNAVREFTEEEFELYQFKLGNFINSQREKVFKPDRENCSSCKFYIENNCVMDHVKNTGN